MPRLLRPLPLALLAAALTTFGLPARGDDIAPAAPTVAEETKADEAGIFPRKIVLLAGRRDGGHPAGTHEYDATVGVLKAALESSNVADKVKVEVHLDGWPADPAALDDADAIFLASSGADRNPADHPLLSGDRMRVIGRQMDRGCGLMLYHWSVFTPVEHEEEVLRWVGGFFDYQRGDAPRGWFSDIAVAAAKITPNADTPIAKGVPPFELRDEYYYKIRFGENDRRVTPVVTVDLPGVAEPQVVAWATRRRDGGRGFAFTGGHFQGNWDDDAYRTLMVNALCWTAKVPIPAGGVHKPLAFDDQWTPKRHLGKADLPTEKEEDWVDGRIRQTDTGPVFTASIAVPEPGEAPGVPRDNRKGPAEPDMVVKALAIKLGGPSRPGEEGGLPPAAVLFDKSTMVLRCGWAGGFLNHSDARFGLLNKPTIGGEVTWSVPRDAEWRTFSIGANDGSARSKDLRYRGLRLAGDRVVLSYTVDGCEVEESPSAVNLAGFDVCARTLRFKPNDRIVAMPLGGWSGAKGQELADPFGLTPGRFCHFTKDGQAVAVALIPRTGIPYLKINTARLELGGGDDWCRLLVSPNGSAQEYVSLVWRGPENQVTAFREALFKVLLSPAPPRPAATVLESVEEAVTGRQPPRGEPTADRMLLESLLALPEGSAPRWGDPLVTKGVVGTPEPGSPFAVDTITIPHDNPYKALFFTSGFDFTPDGACYVSTAHGDVWKVTGIDDDLGEVRWQRFATGLYEALGVKVRDGEVFVLGRDQITRLHDENGDGEADFYECFNDDLVDLGEAHAYAMCLETDPAGNFYFLKSGAAGTPHGGSLIRVSADGKDLEVFATGFRHPNGLSVGPDGTITAADNEGNWVPVTRVDIVERGEFCGHTPTAHRDIEPTDPGRPLCWLPVVMDNSAGGQVWVPENAWGPLAGRLLHLSYGRCTANLLLKEQVDGVWQGGAVSLPLPPFLSGVCRGRFRTSGAGADGHLYICGLDGWQTDARADGCLQRVRHLGGPLRRSTDVSVYENGLEMTFAEPIDREVAANPARYAVEIWNYRWSKDYGSEDYSVADPTKVGRDPLPVTAATVSADGRTVFLTVERLKPVMQLRVQAGVRTEDGITVPIDYYGTVHRLRPGKSETGSTEAIARP